MLKQAIKKITPLFLINRYHFCLSFLGALIYGFPGRRLKIIGVTGTKGKTTVVEMTKAILEQAGFKTASISSIWFRIGASQWKNKLKMTMPGRFKLQGFLRQAVKAGCQYAVFEVTSEGILQHRHRFIGFDVAVFTNLSPEHIERHGSFEKYREAKEKLFRSCKNVHILNLDDRNVGYFLRFPAQEKFGYVSNENLKIEELKIDRKLEAGNLKFIKAADAKSSKSGISFRVDNICFALNLIGGFNIYNALAAIAIGRSQGIGLGVCQRALAGIREIPGRMETVAGRPFQVIVDYAHTPDSLEKVYQTVSGLKNRAGKTICVLGSCGGGRDKWKRPAMGKIAARYCDEIILTNEDPYDENPLKIIEDIESGFPKIQNSKFKNQNYRKILDRREAIKKALARANPGDAVIITGKGSEPWMCVANGRKIPWDDREIARQALEKNKEIDYNAS